MAGQFFSVFLHEVRHKVGSKKDRFLTESPVGSGASKKFQKYPENDFFFWGGGYTRLIQSYVLLLLECESTCGVLPFCKKTHVQEKSGSWYIPKTSTPMRMHDLYTSELYTISHEVEAGS